MPRLFTALLNQPNEFIEAFDYIFQWEIINAIACGISGLLFVVGSILFLPMHRDHVAVGVWCFIAGSTTYLIVGIHDLVDIHHNCQSKVVLADVAALTINTIGSLFFAVGSILFLPRVGQNQAGAGCFFFGSGLFVLGSVLSTTETIKARHWNAIYVNSTAACFILGSTMFMTASWPYLYSPLSA